MRGRVLIGLDPVMGFGEDRAIGQTDQQRAHRHLPRLGGEARLRQGAVHQAGVGNSHRFLLLVVLRAVKR